MTEPVPDPDPKRWKKSGLKRTSIKRKTPLKRGSSSLKRVPIKNRSKKRAKLYREKRVPLVKEMLAESPWCELASRIRRVAPAYSSCGRYAIGLHELLKRSAGGSLLDRENVLRCCGPCNSWVEDNPNLAHEAGLVIRRGDKRP